jgi:hypothetical protein
MGPERIKWAGVVNPASHGRGDYNRDMGRRVRPLCANCRRQIPKRQDEATCISCGRLVHRWCATGVENITPDDGLLCLKCHQEPL